MTQSLSADDLIRGEIYALEQAGNLLRDAVSLYENQRYASAVVLGIYCREELGRSRIYSVMRRQVRSSGPVNSDEVRDRCKDHVEKLRRGQVQVAVRLAPEQRDLMDAFADPEHPQHDEARKTMDTLFKKQRGRQPHDTHERRMRGLYVEPTEDGVGWNRPCLFDRDEASQLLDDIANDYDGYLSRLRYSDGERYNFLATWASRPELPPPVWPSVELRS